jgi:hypothetical protein
MDTSTFERYLQDIHALNYHGLDDDMPDAFDSWVSELDVEEVINYAENYGEAKFKDGQIKALSEQL